MLPGTTLLSGLELLTDWMPRQGDNLHLQFETIKLFNTAALEIDVYHKNAEDTGNGASVTGTAIGYTTENRHYYEVTGAALKELVRIKVKAIDNSGGSIDPTEKPQWVHFRFLDFIWFDTPNA